MCHKTTATTSGVVVVLMMLLSRSFGAISGYKESSPTQYHIQTDEGNERFFKFQTYNGQYRKERRLDDGTVIGSYGWVDPTGYLRMTDYIADSKGYRVVKDTMQFVGTNSILPEESKKTTIIKKPNGYSVPRKKLGSKVPLKGKVVFKKRVKQTSASSPVLVVYGPLRSANVQSGKLVNPNSGSPALSDEDDVFGKYATPLKSRGKASAFIYNIPNSQYHKEETDKGDGRRQGSYGYVDPFGIRRVIHYSASPSAGFQAARDFQFVGRQEEQY